MQITSKIWAYSIYIELEVFLYIIFFHFPISTLNNNKSK